MEREGKTERERERALCYFVVCMRGRERIVVLLLLCCVVVLFYCIGVARRPSTVGDLRAAVVEQNLK